MPTHLLHYDPIFQFGLWYREALSLPGTYLPQTMCVSTVDENGYPDSRMVLLKDFDNQGFVFYTNKNSIKSHQIHKTNHGALAFYWEKLRKQVRIKGIIGSVSDKEADEYFSSRPRLSQIGAWASLQSEVLDCRKTLEDRVAQFEKKYSGGDVPRPPHWGGYRVRPASIEFWIEVSNRLHDRFLYTHQNDGSWKSVRLYP